MTKKTTRKTSYDSYFNKIHTSGYTGRACKQTAKFCWSWSVPVHDFQIFLGPGLVQSKFLIFYWSWSGPRFFSSPGLVLGPGPNRSVRDQSVLVPWSLLQIRSRLIPSLDDLSTDPGNFPTVGSTVGNTGFYSGSKPDLLFCFEQYFFSLSSILSSIVSRRLHLKKYQKKILISNIAIL